MPWGHSTCSEGASPSPKAEPPRHYVQALICQLVQAGPLHFLQLMLRGSQVVAGPEDPGAYKGAQLLPLTTECVEKQSLVLVSSRGSHSETTGECKKLPTEG